MCRPYAAGAGGEDDDEEPDIDLDGIEMGTL
jgi:hypothetical protein